MKTLKIIFVLIILTISLNSCSYYADEDLDTIENTQLTGDDDEADDGSKE